MGWIIAFQGHIIPFARECDCPFPREILLSFIIFEILFYAAATTKNMFCVEMV